MKGPKSIGSSRSRISGSYAPNDNIIVNNDRLQNKIEKISRKNTMENFSDYPSKTIAEHKDQRYNTNIQIKVRGLK